MPQQIAIIDYSAGNIHSVARVINRLGAKAVVCHSPEQLTGCDKVILPGIGHFRGAVQQLHSSFLWEALNGWALQKPILGICLGMQLMARGSQEAAEQEGFGWLDAAVVRFQQQDFHQYRTPHTGWNSILQSNNNRLLHQVPPDAEFYFSHSFHLTINNKAQLLAETAYGYTFPSIVGKDNLFGVQFHPEKSHEAGSRIVENFLAI